MSDDDDDYMSDKILNACVSGHGKNPNTSLVSQSEKRKIQILERKKLHDELNKKAHPSFKNLELQNREEGLNKPLDETNKGFELLQKMGYTPGTGIGKTGIKTPVPITIKTNRGGLGIESKIKKKSVKMKKDQENEISPTLYRKQIAGKFAEKKLKRDFYNCQRTCQYLDAKKNITEPEDVCYWPNYKREKKLVHVDEETDSEQENSEGSSTENDHDSSDRYNNHPTWYEDKEELEDFEDFEDDYDQNDQCLMTTNEQFVALNSYLRRIHYYCFWCGIEAENELDLNAKCPGDTEDAHDMDINENTDFEDDQLPLNQ